ncbi:unnamed protein product [Caenorhabditis sp. 36 PRJEB53466]|nr:unnamed protein product [Caenorhabditis sp. 36 PRJEB53466]
MDEPSTTEIVEGRCYRDRADIFLILDTCAAMFIDREEDGNSAYNTAKSFMRHFLGYLDEVSTSTEYVRMYIGKKRYNWHYDRLLEDHERMFKDVTVERDPLFTTWTRRFHADHPKAVRYVILTHRRMAVPYVMRDRCLVLNFSTPKHWQIKRHINAETAYHQVFHGDVADASRAVYITNFLPYLFTSVTGGHPIMGKFFGRMKQNAKEPEEPKTVPDEENESKESVETPMIITEIAIIGIGKWWTHEYRDLIGDGVFMGWKGEFQTGMNEFAKHGNLSLICEYPVADSGNDENGHLVTHHIDGLKEAAMALRNGSDGHYFLYGCAQDQITKQKMLVAFCPTSHSEHGSAVDLLGNDDWLHTQDQLKQWDTCKSNVHGFLKLNRYQRFKHYDKDGRQNWSFGYNCLRMSFYKWYEGDECRRDGFYPNATLCLNKNITYSRSIYTNGLLMKAVVIYIYNLHNSGQKSHFFAYGRTSGETDEEYKKQLEKLCHEVHHKLKKAGGTGIFDRCLDSTPFFDTASECGNHMRVTLRFTILAVTAMLFFPVLIFIYAVEANTSVGAQSQEYERSYGVICDAGSTGTRVFVYNWISSSDSELIQIEPVIYDNKPVMKKISPGLSTFGVKPSESAEYLRPLMELAERHIPEDKVPYTPVFIFATAGMRLLPNEQKEAVISNLQSELPKITSMQVLKEHIRIIEGKWEGIYSWIAVNYALGKFNKSAPANIHFPGTSPGHLRHKTVGMIDMGGASAQIAFEMPETEDFTSINVENINLGCREDDTNFKYKLFVTTFLGYGVNEGIRKYEHSLTSRLKEQNGTVIQDDCMPLNLHKTVTLENGENFVRRGTGNWGSCVSEVTKLLNPETKSEVCKAEVAKCYFGAVPAPKVPLSDVEIYGFSEYWYSTHDVLGLGGQYNADLISKKSQQYCSQRWSTIQAAFKKNLYPRADEDRLKTQCFKSAWITSVLHDGFSVDKTQNKFQSVSTIAGQEVQWALGAMIYHMRFFPLRDSSRNLVVKETHSASESLWAPLFFLSAVFLLFVLVCAKEQSVLCFDDKRRASFGLSRSQYSYKMLKENRTSSSFLENFA